MGKHQQQREQVPTVIDRVVTWIGSEGSIAVHTTLFLAAFAFALFGVVSWATMLLVVTTVVSLEAIYLAIFIQMTVNKHSESLREVEHDLDEIEEDLDELQEDVEEMNEDDRDEERNRQSVALEVITTDIHRILADLEELKQGK